MRRQFAESYIPSTLEQTRVGFFSVMTSEKGTDALRMAYSSYADQLGQKAFPAALESLKVTYFQEAGHVVIIFEYPAFATEGEPLMSAMVFGPFPGGTITAEAIDAVPFVYYLLVQARTGTQIIQLSGKSFIGVGPGPDKDPVRFVDWVVRSFGNSGNVEDIPSDDVAMANAIRHAQETLPEVTKRFVAGELQGFCVKVLIESDGQKEHFWLTNTKYADGEYSGTIEEEPHAIKEIVPGTFVEAPASQVTDWMYIENGKMEGNHTLRAMLERMPPLQRAKYAEHLAGYSAPTPAAVPPPLPPSAMGKKKAQNFTFAQSLKGWPDLKTLRTRCRQVVRSRQLLTPMYKRMHHGYLMYLGGYLYAKWKKMEIEGIREQMRNRGVRNPFLRDGYRSLSWAGEIMIGHPIIANTMLGDEEEAGGLAVPALMLGCLDMDEKVQDQAARLAEKLAEIYTMGADDAADAPLEELVQDDTFRLWRRRVIPPEFTNGVRMELFDVLLFHGQLPPTLGPIPFLMKKAKPGKRAPILHIPWDVVKAIAEYR